MGYSIEKCVLTIPPTYNRVQMKVIKEACLIAGLTCEDLLKEPIAAAMAFGITKLNKPDKEYCLVVDWGASVIDITVLCYGSKNAEIKYVKSDHTLGGSALDLALAADSFFKFRQ